MSDTSDNTTPVDERELESEIRRNRLTSLEELYIEGGTIPEDMSVEEIRTMLEADGISISSPSYTKSLQESLRPIRSELDEERSNSRQRPASFIRLRNAALNIRDGVSLFFSLLFYGLLPLLTVFFLFLSETFSAFLGARTFMPDGLELFVAGLLSITITSSYFVIAWRRAGLEYALSQKQQQRTQYYWTLANAYRMFRYRISLDTTMDLMEKEVHPEEDEIKRIFWIEIFILVLLVVLGMLGRLHDSLTLYDGVPWHVAIGRIFTDSDLNTSSQLFSASFVAIVLLVGTGFVIRMVLENFEAIGGGQSDSFFSERSGELRLREQERLFWRNVAQKRINNATKQRHIEEKYIRFKEAMELQQSQADQNQPQEGMPLPNSMPETNSISDDSNQSMNEDSEFSNLKTGGN